MPGCTILHLCEVSQYNASTGDNGVCSYFSLLSDLCADMPGMEETTCNNLTSMCYPLTGNSTVEECNTLTLVETLPTFMETKMNLQGLCSTNAPNQTLCDTCTAHNYMCDMLSVYTGLCAIAPNRTECAKAKTFCESVSYANWPVCLDLLQSITPQEPQSMEPSAPGPMHNMPSMNPSSPSSPSAIMEPHGSASSLSASIAAPFILVLAAILL